MLYIMATLIVVFAMAPVILTLGRKRPSQGVVFTLIIANIASVSLGWTVGMKIGFEIAGTWGAIVGLLGTAALASLACVLADDLAS